MTEVKKVDSGVAPNASDTQPAAVAGNPGVGAQGSTAANAEVGFPRGDRPEAGTKEGLSTENSGTVIEGDRVIRVSDIDKDEETKDMAGVRVDPITGIAVEQIEASAGDFPKTRGGMYSVPIQAFDSRKLSGSEEVTVRGNTVIINDPDYAGDPNVTSTDADGRKVEKYDESELPKSTREEMKAGREAINRKD